VSKGEWHRAPLLVVRYLTTNDPVWLHTVSSGLFSELRRRNVLRAAAFYAAAGWLLVQIATQVFPVFDIPAWAMRMVVIVVVVGFPFAMLFSWFYEFTPQGLKREAEVERSQSIVRSTGKKLDRWIIATLAVAVALLLIDKFALHRAPIQASGAPDKSIAVLPFTDLSPSHDQEYFSDGMAEEILNALAQVPDLKVAGRTSSFYFKGKNENLHAIGQTLGVANILEGSVRKQGDKVRITAQLINAADDSHLWSHEYDGSMSDVFELQESIARSITEQLKVMLVDDQRMRFASKAAPNAEAYQQYLRGEYFWHQRGYENLQNAVTAFKAALAIDANYADAWAGLARTYAILPEYYSAETATGDAVPETVDAALDAADHALKLDPASTSALLARAYIRGARKYEWVAAETDFRAVIAAHPRDSTAHQWYGEMLIYERRLSDADEQLEAALKIDPLSPVAQHLRGFSLMFQKKYDAALPYFEETLRISPGFVFSTAWKVLVLIKLQRFDDALAATNAMTEPRRGLMVALVMGMRDEVKRDATIALLRKYAPKTDMLSPITMAMLGRNDLALEAIEEMDKLHAPFVAYANANPEFDPLRTDPQFQAIMRRFNLPTPTP
jgi:TolB-like protein/Tfp pilus assembly protein PilF